MTLKRTKLRKVSKNPIKALKNRADRVLQDYFRKNYPDLKCVCGNPAELQHHYILKSVSNYLRYDEKNLIPLCQHCHSLIHFYGKGKIIEGKVAVERGADWIKYIEEGQKKHIVLTKKYLEEIIKCYG